MKTSPILKHALAAALGLTMMTDAFCYKLKNFEINVDGIKRDGMVLIPTTSKSEGRRKILTFFHGGNGEAQRAYDMTNIQGYVDSENLIVVFPNAVAAGPQQNRHWNDGRDETSDRGDDVALAKKIVKKAYNKWHGDENQAFVAGISSGGMMTNRLICEATKTFKGFVQVVATMAEDLYYENPDARFSKADCQPQGPFNSMIIVGTEDRLMRYEGGEITSSAKKGVGGFTISAQKVKELYLQSSECLPYPQAESKIDTADDGMHVEKQVFRKCKGKKRHIFMDVIGGGHGYPTPEMKNNSAGRDIDTTKEIIRFMRQVK